MLNKMQGNQREICNKFNIWQMPKLYLSEWTTLWNETNVGIYRQLFRIFVIIL